MDELDMMSLELPSTEGLDDLDNPERSGGGAEGGSVTENAASESGSGDRGDRGEHGHRDEDYSYEYEGGELEDMAVPMLSEMDGSELGTPITNAAANAAAAKTVSLDKPETGGGSSGGTVGLSEMSGAPAFSEMSGAPAGGQTGQYGGQGMNGQYGSNATGNSFGNNANNPSYNSPNNMQYQQGQQGQQGGYGRQNTYAPVNPGSTNGGGMSQNGGRSDYLDIMGQDAPLVARGEKIAKVISTIIIIISALDLLVGVLNFAARTVMAAAYRIYFSVQLKNGSHYSRFWLGLGCVLSLILNIITMFQISSVAYSEALITGSTLITTILEAIYLIPTIGFGIMTYFLMFDKSVAAYCDRSGGRGNL